MRTMVFMLAMLALAVPARAHGQSGLSIEPVKEGLYTIPRPGGNVGVRVGPDGVTLIDDEYPQNFAEIQELVGQVSDLPVIYVLSTRTTVAPERVREYGPRQPEFQTAVHIGGFDVRAIYTGPEQTDADAIIYFPDLKTVLGGDLLNGTEPFVDYANGESRRNWIDSVDKLLTLDFDTAIPKHGAVMDRTDVVRFRDRLVAVRAHMTELAQSRIPNRAGPIRTPEFTWLTLDRL